MTTTLLWTLVSLQIAMGAFDTLYHHEFTERLAWRATAHNELKLHAVRNAFYGALFLTLAWSRPTGWLAVLVILVLVTELLITLWDFVEEDLSRHLPASERVTHTLLALNYGGILVLLIPELLAAAAQPTALIATNYGFGSILLTVSAIAVTMFGIRDWFMSGRSQRLAAPPAAPLVAALPPRQRLLITGATGFIGERLVAALAANGHDVTALVRRPETAVNLAAPVRIVTRLQQIPNDARFDAVINLAGEPVAGWLWTRAYRHRLLRSRIKTTRALVAVIARLDTKPRALISGSAIGIYGERGDEHLSEADTTGQGFAAGLCATWEKEALKATSQGVRVVRLRIGLVLGHEGGMLARMLPAFDLGLGGPMGRGGQWMSWITRDDLVRLIAFAIATPDLDGALNATAPTPVRNTEFAQALGAALGRPAYLSVPAWPLRAALGPLADELLLASQRVLPVKAEASGFKFLDRDIGRALALVSGGKSPPAETHAITFPACAPALPARGSARAK
jgi:uncharacterized protein